MRAKLKDGNQLVLPEEIALALHGAEYVDVELKEGRLVLRPDRQTSIDDVHDKLEKMGITEKDVADAVAWARRGGDPIAPGS